MKINIYIIFILYLLNKLSYKSNYKNNYKNNKLIRLELIIFII